MQLVQDSAKIHSAKKIKTWFENNAIPVIEWPPYSPDLNLIENAWPKLKERIYKIDPSIQLQHLTGTSEEVRTVFAKAIERVGEDLGPDYFDGLIKPMNNRVKCS